MVFWPKFFSAPEKIQPSTDVDRILSYLETFINRRELANRCFELKQKADDLSGEEKEIQLTRAYFCFEKFITSNKPLIVKKEISANELRKEIIDRGITKDIFLKLKLPFLSEKERLLSIFIIATHDTVKYLKANIGEENFNIILNNALIGNRLGGLISLAEGSLRFEQPEEVEQINIKELQYSLKILFDNLIKEISSGFGEKMSEAILRSSFNIFSSIYPLEFIKIFLDISPLEFLMEEKISFLEREELQKKFTEVVGKEKEKSNEAEVLSKQLQSTVSELNASKTAILNLLEDVGAEKDRVEKEVEKRTKELKSEQAVLRATIDSLPLAYFLIDHNLVLLENNSLLPSIFSLDKINNFADMEKKFDGFFPIRERCLSVLNYMKPEIFKDVSLMNKFFKIYLQPIASTETGEKRGLLGLIEDITEQKVLDRSKDEFFSIASHELRTPLTAIMGNTSMILEFFEEQLPNDDIKQMVRDVHEATTRLLKIVADFLDVSRLEQGKIIFKLEDFDLGVLVQEMFRDFESMATLKGLSLRIGEIPKDIFVIGDRDKVKQIVSNLISNAIKFTSKGEVSIFIKKDEPGKVSLYVKDSGVGVSKENQILLFRKFQQAQEKILTRDASRGTGLGLYISRLLANSMNGRVELAESEQGRGSTFKLVLPAKI